jgi:hypothetical protein
MHNFQASDVPAGDEPKQNSKSSFEKGIRMCAAQKQVQRPSQTTKPSNKLPEQLLFSIVQAAVVLGGLSPRSVRYLISDGELKITRVRGRVFIHRQELIRFASEDHANPIVEPKAGA